MEKPEYLVKDGKRLDGRKLNELRKIKMKVGVVDNADGSAMVSFGNTKVIAAVYGPREVHPRHLADPEKALLRARYDMFSFSVEDRKKPGPGRREIEISKVVTEALSAAVFLEKFPRTAIDVFIEVVQADASTRVTGINAASLALADAGIPMRDLVVALSFGKLYDAEGKTSLAVDLFKPEDQFGLADVAVALMPSLEKILLLQMDGNLTVKELKEGFSLIKKPVAKIYEAQKKALKESLVVEV